MRRECYPSLPPVDWVSTVAHRRARRAALDRRNELIAEVGATRAVKASAKTGTIGCPSKERAK